MNRLIKKIIPNFLVGLYHFLLSFCAAIFYGFPSRNIKIIGITGTKGKTTVVTLAGKILEEAGFKVGWISSGTIKVGDKEWLNPYHMTMPGRTLTQKFLSQMVSAKCQHALIEVTSEGILQSRHKFIDFDTVVFTNLAPEHIEAHGGFEKYREAKGRLFKTTEATHVINLDNENSGYFLKFPAKRKIGFTMGSKTVPDIEVVNASDFSENSGGISFRVDSTEFDLKLFGRFNAANALCAICVAISRGISLEICKAGLERVSGIPGRVESIDEGQNFKVIVDLAHTPGSFEEIFKLAKSLPHDKIISVFGSAGGGRDKWKRPELGKIAAKYSDEIILTNEDCYDEDPLKILSEIKEGVIKTDFQTQNLYEIIDRKEAIKKAFRLARENDIVLLLGKGTEQIMDIGFKKIHWDEREVAREELKLL